MTLLTVQDFRERAGIGDPQFDEQIPLLMASITRTLEQVTGRPWEKNTTDLAFFEMSNDRSDKLWLPRLPVIAITKVEERYPTESTWTEVDSTGYIMDNPNTGRVERLKKFWRPRVRVTYSGGHDETTTPEDVKAAIVAQAKFVWVRLQKEKIGSKSISLQGGSTEFMERADLHPLFKMTARQNRRLV